MSTRPRWMRAALVLVVAATSCDSTETHPVSDAGVDIVGHDLLAADRAIDSPPGAADLGQSDAPMEASYPDLALDVAPQDAGPCQVDADCDDGLACTDNSCVGGLCVTKPLFDCDWPAEPALQATNLTHIEGPLVNGFHKDLSGAVWDPVAQRLWVCRNTGSDSKIWAVEPDGKGSFQIAHKGGQRGEWTGFGDLEGLTLADLNEPETLYLIIEGSNRIQEVDLSTYGTAVVKNDWSTGSSMPGYGGNSGGEGITFVPDSFLAAQGFVDASGAPYVSKHGMGGLMLVGHQSNGAIYAFDLDRKSGTFSLVGEYQTAGYETAGLELDRSTGLLYIWHGADLNKLEAARLSSSTVSAKRTLDAVMVYKGPAKIPFGSENHEGIALMSIASCKNGERGFFLTTDGGGFWSLLWYRQFPCQ